MQLDSDPESREPSAVQDPRLSFNLLKRSRSAPLGQLQVSLTPERRNPEAEATVGVSAPPLTHTLGKIRAHLMDS